MDLNDEALVEKFRQTKEMSLFKTLVRRYQNRIYNAAFRMLGNREEAEEVVQDTFIKMHQSMDSFRRQSTFAAQPLRYRIIFQLIELGLKKEEQIFRCFHLIPSQL